MIAGIMTILLADSNITGLVDDRIYPVVAEQKSGKTYLTIRRTGVSPQIAKNQTSDTDQVNFVVAAYADEYKKCVAVLELVRDALDNYTGITDTSNVNFIKIWYQISEDFYVHEEETYAIVDTYAARVKR